jgi:hypothetical protein
MSPRSSKREAVFRVFTSFDEENEHEHDRLASLTPLQRWGEFAVLQRRVFGEKWTSEPMVKKVTFETVEW